VVSAREAQLKRKDTSMQCNLPPRPQTVEAVGAAHPSSLPETLDELERDLILEALKSTRGNMAKAARSLGVSERVMGLRVHKHGIDAKQFRTAP
jgi:Nif-specific regulatory protein